MSSLFYTISGLPVHALIVHFAVVLLPLAAVSVVASIYSPKYRHKYLRASLIGTFLGTGAAYVAKESGEALAEQLGTPVTHSKLGTALAVSAAVFFIAALYWNWTRTKKSSGGIDLVGNATALIGVVVIGLTVITGHTGAQAVWQGKLPTTSSQSSSSQSSSQSTAQSSATKSTSAQSAPQKGVKTISMATVKTHASASSCWSAINGNVYDLTRWINRHPGGASVIKALCGTDGTARFTGQHGGQSAPAAALAGYKIGVLG